MEARPIPTSINLDRAIFAWPWKNQNQRRYTNQSARPSKHAQYFVLTCIYLSLLVSRYPMKYRVQSDWPINQSINQCHGVGLTALTGSITSLWISLVVFGSKLLNKLTVHVALASKKENQMDVDVIYGSEGWPHFANERRLLSYLLDECASSQFKPGKSWFAPVLLFLIHLAMKYTPRECKYTAWFSRLVIVLQFVFNFFIL